MSESEAPVRSMAAEANPPTLRGRPPIVRAAPETIEDHLSMAYAARYRLEGSESEDWGLVVKRLAKAGYTREKLKALHAEKAAVSLRCVVSQVHADALAEAMEDLPAA